MKQTKFQKKARANLRAAINILTHEDAEAIYNAQLEGEAHPRMTQIARLVAEVHRADEEALRNYGQQMGLFTDETNFAARLSNMFQKTLL